ncbi:gas vesicle protein GvpG [bacterium]|nr:gas vesicle protein GvpG [bacterium]
MVRCAFLFGFTLFLSGCFLASSGEQTHYHEQITLGSELLDLQKARESGVISEEEFLMLKHATLKRALGEEQGA